MKMWSLVYVCLESNKRITVSFVTMEKLRTMDSQLVLAPRPWIQMQQGPVVLSHKFKPLNIKIKSECGSGPDLIPHPPLHIQQSLQKNIPLHARIDPQHGHQSWTATSLLWWDAQFLYCRCSHRQQSSYPHSASSSNRPQGSPAVAWNALWRCTRHGTC